ncbi:MAG: MucR family transcriptional regulator [Desulfovibrionaceae bacterium]|nr:MucR family transcriptional regulator [Desulfovibrionaceae bacterium]
MEELELMTAIIASNPGVNVEDAWKIYRELVTRVHALNSQLKVGGESGAAPEIVGDGQVPEGAKTVKESLTRGYTKRNLKVKPQDAIKKDVIICCICGKSMSSINARHLASHNGLSKEGYLKLCGYPADQVLMSLNHLSKMKTQVLKAQKAREKKQKESGKAPVKVRKGKKDAPAS